MQLGSTLGISLSNPSPYLCTCPTMQSPECVSSADLMYIADAIPQLVESLAMLSDNGTEILLAHGRNRQAEALFFKEVQEVFTATRLPGSDLDEKYQCVDVDVYLLQKCRT